MISWIKKILKKESVPKEAPLNIYSVPYSDEQWVQCTAIVIAKDKHAADKKLELREGEYFDVMIKLIGVCTDGTSKETVICQQMFNVEEILNKPKIDNGCFKIRQKWN